MAMKQYLLTPGPTPLPPEVLAAQAQPMIHHRTPLYQALFRRVRDRLQAVLRTKNPILPYAASGTGSMEASVVNLLSPGEEAVVIEGGVFGQRFSQICHRYGIQVRAVEVPYGEAVDPEQVATALTHKTRAVFGTLYETSTGVRHDLQAVGRLVNGHAAVFVVDAISGLLADDLDTDGWGVDVVVGGSQKGLMSPPGVSFVSVSEKAWRRVAEAKSPRFYFDFLQLRRAIEHESTPFTPAISLMRALDAALSLIEAEGLDRVLERHRLLARATRAGVHALGLALFAKVPSDALTAVEVPPGLDDVALVKRLQQQSGVTLARGQGELAGRILRIAHMGYMDQTDVLIALAALERGLHEFGQRVHLGSAVKAAEEVFTAAAPPLERVAAGSAERSFGL